MKKIVNGMGGWLTFFSFGFIISLLLLLFLFFTYGYLLFFEFSLYNLIVFIFSTLLTCMIGYSLVLEWKLKKEFPKWVVASLCVMIAFGFLSFMLDGDFSGLGRDIIVSVIWIWYFSVSKRVKNTFVK